MTIDFAGLLYGPVYDQFGLDAELTIAETGEVKALRVLDASVPLDNGRVQSIRSGYTVRRSELSDKGVALKDLQGSTLLVNGTSRRIEFYVSKSVSSPASGEIDMVLSETE